MIKLVIIFITINFYSFNLIWLFVFLLTFINVSFLYVYWINMYIYRYSNLYYNVFLIYFYLIYEKFWTYRWWNDGVFFPVKNVDGYRNLAQVVCFRIRCSISFQVFFFTIVESLKHLGICSRHGWIQWIICLCYVIVL